MVKTCLRCHASGEPEWRNSGSFGLECLLWLVALPIGFFFTWWVLLFPGAYSLIRAVSKSLVCKMCGSKELVPYDSPAAQKLRAGP